MPLCSSTNGQKMSLLTHQKPGDRSQTHSSEAWEPHVKIKQTRILRKRGFSAPQQRAQKLTKVSSCWVITGSGLEKHR